MKVFYHPYPGKQQFTIVLSEGEYWEVPWMPDGWDSRKKMPSSISHIVNREYYNQEWAKKYLKIK